MKTWGTGLTTPKAQSEGTKIENLELRWRFKPTSTKNVEHVWPCCFSLLLSTWREARVFIFDIVSIRFSGFCPVFNAWKVSGWRDVHWYMNNWIKTIGHILLNNIFGWKPLSRVRGSQIPGQKRPKTTSRDLGQQVWRSLKRPRATSMLSNKKVLTVRRLKIPKPRWEQQVSKPPFFTFLHMNSFEIFEKWSSRSCCVWCCFQNTRSWSRRLSFSGIKMAKHIPQGSSWNWAQKIPNPRFWRGSLQKTNCLWNLWDVDFRILYGVCLAMLFFLS